MKKMYPYIIVLSLLVVGIAQTEEVGAESIAPEIRLVAPWELSGPLVIVWPERLSGGRRMIPDALALIQDLPEGVEVALAGERPPRIQWVAEMGRDTQYLPITTARTREVGMWAGLPAATDEGRLISVRFQLPLRFVERRERAEFRDHHEAARQLGRLLYGESHDEIPLRLSPLQITHNGRGTALISNRVITENEHLSLTEIRERLRIHAGLETVIFVPVPETEPQGFIDGHVRFVDHDRLLIAEPLPNDLDSRDQHRDLLRLLDEELDSDIQHVRVPRPGTDPLAGASYLHLIQVDSELIVPQFGASEDKPVVSLLKNTLPEMNIVTISADTMDGEARDLRLNRMAVWR